MPLQQSQHSFDPGNMLSHVHNLHPYLRTLATGPRRHEVQDSGGGRQPPRSSWCRVLHNAVAYFYREEGGGEDNCCIAHDEVDEHRDVAVISTSLPCSKAKFNINLVLCLVEICSNLKSKVMYPLLIQMLQFRKFEVKGPI